jgi:hypothetical protein
MARDKSTRTGETSKSKKPSVDIAITDEELDQASGGIRGGNTQNSLVCHAETRIVDRGNSDRCP